MNLLTKSGGKQIKKDKEIYKTEESEQLYRNLFEMAPDGIITVSLRGVVTSCNPAFLKLSGFSKNEIIGKHISTLPTLRKRDLPKSLKIFHFLLKEKATKPVEFKWVRKGGEIRLADVRASLIKKDGKTIGIQGVVRDITENRRAEEKINEQNIKLKELDKIKSDFLNMTSHELRTPITSIKGYVQILLKQSLGEVNNEQKKVLDIIQRNANRLDNLIQDLLDISRLESGTMKFITTETNIQKMIEASVDIMKPVVDLKDIRINIDGEENIPDLTIDKERIKQVLINLLNNAIKFSSERSTINIITKNEIDEVLFEVQDFGRGIPKDKQNMIFNSFFQVDSKKDQKFGGAGLGLAISRGIVLAHGGKIWVESKKNKGSTFSFTLPIKPIKDIEKRFKEINYSSNGF